MSNRARASAQRRTADSNSTSISIGLADQHQHHHNGSRNKATKHHHRHADGLGSAMAADGPVDAADYYDLIDDPCAVTAQSSLLQPRIAFVLGLSKTWYPLLFICRLLSILPAVWSGLPSCLRLLAMTHLMYLGRNGCKGGLPNPSPGGGAGPADGTPAAAGGTHSFDMSFEARLRLTETLLATIWVRYPRLNRPIP